MFLTTLRADVCCPESGRIVRGTGLLVVAGPVAMLLATSGTDVLTRLRECVACRRTTLRHSLTALSATVLAALAAFAITIAVSVTALGMELVDVGRQGLSVEATVGRCTHLLADAVVDRSAAGLDAAHHAATLPLLLLLLLFALSLLLLFVRGCLTDAGYDEVLRHFSPKESVY